MPASLSGRVVTRLAQAEACELNPHYCDDLRIARLTVHYAASGEAVLCAPHVLASYIVLGLHPEKVWPAVLARRTALGSPVEEKAPKKPAQSVPLWCEKTNAARASNSRGGNTLLRDNTIRVPMAAPSIAALYPNSDAPSSAKKRGFTFDEMLAIVEFSGAPHSIRQGTLSALKARGRWPNEDGAATGVICVSLLGMQFHGVCCRSTARWRTRRAVKLGFWRELREANSWSDCPKCGTGRSCGTCDKCGYRGRARTPEGKANFDEFCRPSMYEIDIEKFRSAPRPREIRHFDARTYAEYKQAAKRGEHPNVTEMPSRKPVQPDPHPPAPPPATAAPVKQPAAEHAHRNTGRIEPKAAQPKLTKRECAKLVADVAERMKGTTRWQDRVGGLSGDLDPGDPRYRPKMSFRDALEEVAQIWKRDPDMVRHALKFWGYQLQE
ncbi:MAG TPA: hypothetical protein VFF58_00455 [Candidatus Nitrosotalea sp.]|nr:hypothetical protein [Candidatus Nitrosotalea sp.]